MKNFYSDDSRFKEIRRKKMDQIKRKQEEIINTKYKFAPRY